MLYGMLAILLSVVLAGPAVSATRAKGGAVKGREKIPTEKAVQVVLSSINWRVTAPMGFSGKDMHWERPLPLKDAKEREAVIHDVEEIDFHQTRIRPGSDCRPDEDVRFVAGNHFGLATRSYTCIDRSGAIEERYEVLTEGLIRVRLQYKTYVPADTAWLTLSEQARDKLRPGRAIFRQIQGTLAPIEPASQATPAAPPAASEPSPQQVAPLLR